MNGGCESFKRAHFALLPLDILDKDVKVAYGFSMKVTITDEALMQVAELPRTIGPRVLTVIERLQKWPQVSGVKWLTGDWKGHARVRTGDYRVIFRLVAEELIVVRIANRRDAYFD